MRSLASRLGRSAISKRNPLLDILPVPEPRAQDNDHRRREVSGLWEALAGLPADELQDLARADEIGGIDLLGL